MRMQETSLEAYASVNFGNYPLKDKVLICLLAGGLTDEEIEDKLVAKHQTVSACRNNLMKKKWVEDSGERRPTSSGRDAIVWVLTPEGEDYILNWVLGG